MEAIDKEDYDDEDDRQATATSATTATRAKGQGMMTKGHQRPRERNEPQAQTIINYHGNFKINKYSTGLDATTFLRHRILTTKTTRWQKTQALRDDKYHLRVDKLFYIDEHILGEYNIVTVLQLMQPVKPR
eukprot:474914-Amphidinium_carterae.1